MAKIIVEDYTRLQMEPVIYCIGLLKTQSELTDEEIVEFLGKGYGFGCTCVKECLDEYYEKVGWGLWATLMMMVTIMYIGMVLA